MRRWVLLAAWLITACIAARAEVHANVQPPADVVPADADCACAVVPNETQRLRTQVRLLQAEARVNSGIHAKVVKQLNAVKGCMDLVDQTKLADCKMFLR